MSRDRIAEALAAGRIPLGMQSFVGAPSLIEIMAHTGFDFVMIDTEHASVNPETLEHLIRAADSSGITPLVRVEEGLPGPIRKALEAGAAGVVVPRVGTSDDVRRAIDAAYYPPHGKRGMCPATRAAGYSMDGWSAFVERTHAEVMVIPLIETPEAIENARAICSLPEVRIVFFGPGDLGMALGAGGAGMGDSRVREAFGELIRIARECDTLVMAVPFPDLSTQACRDLLDAGVGILMHSIDELLFAQVCRGIVSDLAEVLGGSR